MTEPSADLSSINVISFDDALIVVDKPAGLPSVPGRAPGLEDCAWSRVQQRFADALVVHRLDMATSGLLVFARGPVMQRTLSRAFAERGVHKTYVAEVYGLLHDDAGSIDLPLIADWPNRPRQIVDHERGKPALTHWRVLSRDALHARSLLRLEPVTGRTHQLRVHLQAIGHPIVGDALYGVDQASMDATRMFPMRLHALSIELVHPASALLMSYSTKEPPWLTHATTIISTRNAA